METFIKTDNMEQKTNTFRFLKVRNVKTPSRGTNLSAGIDFYIPDDQPIQKIFPGESANIPSGLKVRIPEGYALVMFNKSGRAVKDSLMVGACVIDEDYKGECHLHVINTGRDEIILRPGEKLVQGLLLPIGKHPMEEVFDEDKLFDGLESERGEGGFGSTGLK